MKKKQLRMMAFGLVIFVVIAASGAIYYKNYKKEQITIEVPIIDIAIDKSISSFNSENVDEYIDTLDVSNREEAKRNIEESFRKYNYQVKVISQTVESLNSKEAVLLVEQQITDLSIPMDNEQIIKSRISLRKIDDVWKIYKTENEKE